MGEFSRAGNDPAAYRNRIKNDPQAAEVYKYRKATKHQAEMALVERGFCCIPQSNTVLDIPCGAGRVTILLERLGYRCTGAEISDAMIEVARQEIAAAELGSRIDKIDIEDMDYPDRQFGAIICFRLFHHFPNPQVRRRVVKEMCRVASEYVALSYFSPLSPTSLRRAFRATVSGKISRQYATPLTEIAAYFQECGFGLVKDFAQTPWMHTLHLAIFKRKPA